MKFLFFSLNISLFYSKISLFMSPFQRKHYKKIHGAITLTATAPLLNLNLNYEKLRGKGRNKKLFNVSSMNYN